MQLLIKIGKLKVIPPPPGTNQGYTIAHAAPP